MTAVTGILALLLVPRLVVPPAPAAAQDDCQSGARFAAVIAWPWGRSVPAQSRDQLPTVVDFEARAGLDPDARRALATYGATGSVFGLAWDGRRGRLYAGAHARSSAPFGPGGPGQIYEVDPATATVRPWAALAAGPLPPDGFTLEPAVGRTGLGDLDVDDAGETLVAVNLYDRRIYRLALPGGAVLGSFPIGAAGTAWAANARPFGLAIRDGWLYHGVVDSRADRTLPGDLAATVYRSRLDGSGLAEVARVSLRGGRWNPWSDDPAAQARSQALLADLELRPNGDLILGLRDRSQDLFWGLDHRETWPLGELLQARRDGERWVVDHQVADYRPETRHWPEPIQGGLAAWPGRDWVLATSLEAFRRSAGSFPWEYAGVLAFDNTTGRRTLGVGLAACICQPLSDAMGDVESLCRAFGTAEPTPTATGTATPTNTDAPTATDSPTPLWTTATPRDTDVPPSPTATRAPPRPLVLPLLLKEACPDSIPVDVALALDMSSSMQRPARDGRSKAEAAVAAAAAFVDLLNLGADPRGRQDRGAVVGFNDRAWTEAPLTGEAAALHLALRRLPGQIREGTRLDLALDRAGEALVDAPWPGRQAVVILLTDGLPNQEPAELARRAAARLKDRGITVVTIGLGQPGDFDDELLRSLASAGYDYYAVPDAADLAAVFRGLGDPCPGSWPAPVIYLAGRARSAER